MKLLRMLALLASVSFAVPQVALATPEVAKLAQSRADAAARAYADALVAWRSGTHSVDTVYLWSVRWLAATLDATGKPAGLADHLKRTQDLEKEVLARYKAGLTSTLEVQAASYYRIEAELWEARGKMN